MKNFRGRFVGTLILFTSLLFFFKSHDKIWKGVSAVDKNLSTVLIRKNLPKDEESLVQVLQEKLPNVPFLYWQKHKDRKFSNCSKIPDLINLRYNNLYWQVKKTKFNTFFLYAAYFDTRETIFSFICYNNNLNSLLKSSKLALIFKKKGFKQKIQRDWTCNQNTRNDKE